MDRARLFTGAEATGPRLFCLPPGVDFPRLLIAGLRARLQGQPPEAMARITLFVNTERMRRRIVDLMSAEGAGFLPRIRLVTDLAPEAARAGIAAPVPTLRRRLEIAQLVRRLLAVEPDLAPASAAYDLADSLADLIDEMQGEGVLPETVMGLDVSQHSAHWQRTQKILNIVVPLFTDGAAPDAQMQLRRTVEALAGVWKLTPPADPVVIAGSTGSRGTTAALMRLVAGLPQGAIVLPGYDDATPASVWDRLEDALTAEDHPQYRFHRLVQMMGIGHADIRPWVAARAPAPSRNRLVSLALRPAPITDQWIAEGATLDDLPSATEDMTLIEAENPRQEALALALILREAAESDIRVALITPDRGLTRMVTAALDRWGIRPDDSAGRPLGLTPPGRLLRHLAGLFGQRITGEDLLILLKHPLTATGADRGQHLLFSRDLELHIRKHGPAFPTAQTVSAWGNAQRTPERVAPWCEWIGRVLSALADPEGETGPIELSDHVARHLALAELLAQGPGSAPSSLWVREAGEMARSLMDNLATEAPHGGTMTNAEYRNLLDALIARGEVREDVVAHPRIMIWGTLEARVQGADLVLLAGLNDGIWPQLPPPDPWLNRQMRLAAGLLLPERRIGLSAHDFQQAIAAPRVVLSRSVRDAEAQTVPSRWLNRLSNLMAGLPDRRGPEALAAMRDRGRLWLDRARLLERPETALAPAPRPSPRPPVAARPDRLSVTTIARLIRDPYAVYARHVLRLSPLDPLTQSPDARLRGSVLHLILEAYVRERRKHATAGEPREMARARLMDITHRVLESEVPWPDARALWQARLARAADFFLDQDERHGGTPVVLETRGKVRLDPLDFTLTAQPDRIDLLPDGRIHLIDYKTGNPPSADAQKHFEKQLLIEAAMATRGAFSELGPVEPARATYVGLGASPEISEPDVDAATLETVWADLIRLIRRYMQADQGYTSRRAPAKADEAGDYDHLARYGEWGMGDAPGPEDVG
ncbi:double-strand break repair protein AddB [Aliigemmobacter aestuarii]|uniref:Double-strand break repair protein AddB n=1 Tax=Aliigemmobacter aestuarii TaxID=1445661 RepID=A0A4V3V0X7_9RHOB|nr:double-strand break repair protein AddB [Gemmobacter aestuarii]THD85672.1 double-strand break repair protein AddB [Gemmobacter aestuarii]